MICATFTCNHFKEHTMNLLKILGSAAKTSFLPLSIGSELYGAFSAKRETDQQRRSIDRAISGVQSQRDALAQDNRTAYGNALAFMSANRGDPNAWRFASGTYDSRLSSNTRQDNRMLGMITDLRAQKPRRIGWGETLARGGLGALTSIMTNNLLKESMVGSSGSTAPTFNPLIPVERRGLVPRII